MTQNTKSHQRQLIAEPPRARGGAPIAIENGNLSIRENLVMTLAYVRPSKLPYGPGREGSFELILVDYPADQREVQKKNTRDISSCKQWNYKR